MPPGGRALEPGRQPRGLAVTRGADDDQHLAVGERQIDAVKYIDRAEALRRPRSSRLAIGANRAAIAVLLPGADGQWSEWPPGISRR